MQLMKKIKPGANEGSSISFSTAIIENSPDCLKILDAEGRLEFMNTTGQCLMEIDDFDLVKGQCWWDLWGEDEKETVRLAFQQALEGNTQQFVAKCITPKGKNKWWDVLISPVTIDENGVAQVISISRDITERKAQEDSVRRMASHLKLATESANVGTWCLDFRSLTLDWSPLHKRMWGYEDDRTDLLYEDWHSIILPEDKAKAFQKVEEARVNHSFYEVEYRIARADDQSIRWIKSSGLYYYSPSGEALTLTGVSMDITRQKEAEQALAYRKALLEAQNEAVPDGFLIVDTKGNMLTYNKNFATIWGIPDDITERKDDAAALQVAMTKVKDPDAFIERVNYYYANPGEKAWDELQFIDGRIIERHGNRVVDENGTVYGWAWYFRDITQRKKAEDEIKESEERFRHLADNAPMWVWMADENVYVSYANKEILTYLGLQHYSELTAHSWEAFVHPADIPNVYNSLGQANNQPVSFEFRVMNGANGGYEWFQINAVPRDPDKPAGFIGTAININSSKVALQNLSQSEAGFRLLADIMPQHIWTGDEQGNLNYFNNAVYEFSGLSYEDIQKDGWIQIVHPDDREENIRLWTQAVATGEDFFVEHRFRKHTGEYRWQLSRAKPHRNSDGKIIRWVGTSTDIHDQKIKEQQKDEFISIASHEMKTPLTTAKGYLELLQLTLEGDETPHLYASKASQAVQRLQSFVTELLDASKIQNGQLHYNMAPFAFTGLLQETIDNIQHSTKTHRIMLEGNFDGQLNGDRNRLMQVVVNLLTNAIKYSPSADKVWVKQEVKNGKLTVSVTDYGIGMAKEHLEKIFDRYYRVQEHAVFFQGLGIGLYLSFNIVQRHGGSMWAVSEEGKGSTFYFSLPLGSGGESS